MYTCQQLLLSDGSCCICIQTYAQRCVCNAYVACVGRGIYCTVSVQWSPQNHMTSDDASEIDMPAITISAAVNFLVVAVILYSNIAVAQPFSFPREFDWRTKGVVTRVQNQGEFDNLMIVGVSAVESYFAIESGELPALSGAEAADCCNTGFGYVFLCFASIGGLCSAASYPKQLGACHSKSCTPVVKLTGEIKVKSGNETDLLRVLLKRPVLVAVDASHPSFQMYVEGVYSEPSCSADKLDHAMLLVGYGTTEGVDYWICQNTWGEDV